MRVIAGKYRSRPLQSLPGMDIRPTADRLRETLFNVLCAGNPAALEGTNWVDLFAGTGAVGIEALSRGAVQVTFVECSAKAAELIEKNLGSLGLKAGFKVLRSDAATALRKMGAWLSSAQFIFLDPPYRMEDAYSRTLLQLGQPGMLRTTARVIAEHERRFDPGDQFGVLGRIRKLEQGDAALSFYQPQAET